MANMNVFQNGEIIDANPINDNWFKADNRTEINSKVVSQMINSIEEIGLATETVSVNYDGVIYKKGGLIGVKTDVGGLFNFVDFIPNFQTYVKARVINGSNETKIMVLYQKTNLDYEVAEIDLENPTITANVLCTIPEADFPPMHPDAITHGNSATVRYDFGMTSQNKFVVIRWCRSRSGTTIRLYTSFRSYDSSGSIIHTFQNEVQSYNTLQDRASNGYFNQVTYETTYTNAYDADNFLCYTIMLREDSTTIDGTRNRGCNVSLNYNETTGVVSTSINAYSDTSRYWNMQTHHNFIDNNILYTFSYNWQANSGFTTEYLRRDFFSADLNSSPSFTRILEENDGSSDNWSDRIILQTKNIFAVQYGKVSGGGTSATRGEYWDIYIGGTRIANIIDTWTGTGRTKIEKFNHFIEGIEIQIDQNAGAKTINKNIRFDGEIFDRIYFSKLSINSSNFFVLDSNDEPISFSVGSNGIRIMNRTKTTTSYNDVINLTRTPYEIMCYTEFIVNSIWYITLRDVSREFKMSNLGETKDIVMGVWDELGFNPTELTINVSFPGFVTNVEDFSYYTILYYLED